MKQIVFVAAIVGFISCTQSSKEKSVSQKDSTPVNNSNIPKTDTSASLTLAIIPLNNDGDQGQVTFSRQGKTMFYFNNKTKKGMINLNGTEYALEKFSFDPKSNSYTLSGSGVMISAPGFKYVDDEGSGDCSYGNAVLATITMGGAVLKLDKMEVQDCPDY